jgi:hypothetical protein
MIREQASNQCNGTIGRGVYLGHHVRTDFLLLRIAFKSPMDFSPAQPWLYDTLATFAEAVALGASLTLSIDPGELSSGFRLVPPKEDGVGAAEVYLFDTASGGAGYAFDAGENLDQVLDQVEVLLRDCPGNCERSCTKCLRHYGNRFFHPRFDRRLGLQLLRYARVGEVPGVQSAEAQAKYLEPLSRFLALEGWTVRTLEKRGGVTVPLIASPSIRGTTAAVGTYRSLVTGGEAEKKHYLKQALKGGVILLPDYLVEQDLPSAYQELLRQYAAAGKA